MLILILAVNLLAMELPRCTFGGSLKLVVYCHLISSVHTLIFILAVNLLEAELARHLRPLFKHTISKAAKFLKFLMEAAIFVVVVVVESFLTVWQLGRCRQCQKKTNWSYYNFRFLHLRTQMSLNLSWVLAWVLVVAEELLLSSPPSSVLPGFREEGFLHFSFCRY